MGGKNSKNKSKKGSDKNNSKAKKSTTPSFGSELNDNDYNFFTNQTGLSRDEIKSVFDKFNKNNPNGKLDRNDFMGLYCALRPEPPELLDEISNFVFNAFDTNRNGSITFDEFMIAYATTSRGDLRKKLEYTFHLYDTDGNGILDMEEVKTVLTAMLDLIGAEKKEQNIQQLTEECMTQLDKSKNGKITKTEFIEGLMASYSLRSLMSPFN